MKLIQSSKRGSSRREAVLGAGCIVAGAAIGIAAPMVLSSRRAGAQSGGTLRIQLERIGVVDPVSGDRAAISMANQVADALTKLSDTSSVTPSLIESWESTDESRTWVLHVRSGVKWHDGSPLTADSILNVLSNDVCCDPNDSNCENPCPDDKIILPPQGVELADDHTVRIAFDNPQYDLPVYLSHWSNLALRRIDGKVDEASCLIVLDRLA